MNPRSSRALGNHFAPGLFLFLLFPLFFPSQPPEPRPLNRFFSPKPPTAAPNPLALSRCFATAPRVFSPWFPTPLSRSKTPVIQSPWIQPAISFSELVGKGWPCSLSTQQPASLRKLPPLPTSPRSPPTRPPCLWLRKGPGNTCIC